jgi:hypothetical protein
LDFLSGCCRFINPNTEQISWTIFLLVQEDWFKRGRDWLNSFVLQ